jgi:SAM-dependent methyltransferase
VARVDQLRRKVARRFRRVDQAPLQDVVARAYRELLGREPDPAGLESHVAFLAAGASEEQLRAALRSSEEFRSLDRSPFAFESMHRARQAWIVALPPARRILDLGGSSTTSERGALLEMGYPHPFEDLIIVDLPQDLRHDLYATATSPTTARDGEGRVSYLYRSMADLSDLDDGTFDLVCSGQSYEHVTRDEGERVLREVHRVLRPGGTLALDTPNRALTALQLRGSGQEFINPDHKVEYHHREMLELFDRNGFVVDRAAGLNGMPRSAGAGQFDLEELIDSEPVSDDVESAYMLAYLASPR